MFYTYRDIAQYQRRMRDLKNPGEVHEYLVPHFMSFRRASDWSADALDILEKEVTTEINLEDDRFRDEVVPIPWEGKMLTPRNEIAQASNRFRDEYILERVAEGLKTHNRVFAAYGSSHAVMLEPALRALIEESE
jgi:hypothetical protein